MAFRANVKKLFDCIWMGGLPLMCHLSVPAPIGIAESLRSIQRNLTYAILVLPGNTKTAHPARPVRERWKLLLKLYFSHRGHYYMDQVWVAGFFSTLSSAKKWTAEPQNRLFHIGSSKGWNVFGWPDFFQHHLWGAAAEHWDGTSRHVDSEEMKRSASKRPFSHRTR